MIRGSCMCGGVTFELTGEPIGTTLCHCTECRKCAGANGSTNLLVEAEHFHKMGETRSWTRKGISGQDVVYNFCTTCPTIVAVRLESKGGRMSVKAGLLESVRDIKRLSPQREIFVKDRIGPWCERSKDVILKEAN
ncbi:Mss4-like protein [Xylaria venustula]|nr:Mss4-like protein [Xylaria venustula]